MSRENQIEPGEGGDKREEAGERWTRADMVQVGVMVLLTTLLSLRKGPLPEALLITIRYMATYFIYGLAMVLIIVGLTKKIWKYNPGRVKIIKWAVGWAVFFAINQMIHEAYLTVTGQMH